MLKVTGRMSGNNYFSKLFLEPYNPVIDQNISHAEWVQITQLLPESEEIFSWSKPSSVLQTNVFPISDSHILLLSIFQQYLVETKPNH